MGTFIGNDIRKDIPDLKGARWVFVIVLFLIMLIPSVGMLWAQNQETSENRERAPVPELVQEGAFNANVLADAGAYFDDHFAYRSYVIDADARLYSALFGISVADTVVDGVDGWLYYAGTLGDYQREEPLTDAQIRCIAHNMKLFQQWCEAQGASFAFTVAPDKNALYPENMPAYLPGVPNDAMDRLKAVLDEAAVVYADQFQVLRQAEGVQYFLRDSHWSEKGALLGHDGLADALGLRSAGITADMLVPRDDYIGDLNRMLFPVSAIPETDWTAAGVNDGSGRTGALRSGSYWEFLEGADTNDAIVVTSPTSSNPFGVASENGKLLMFRDSFAMGLLPYFACEFEEARFDKMVPYDGLQLLDGEYASVVVERAQRHLADLAADPFIAPSPQISQEVQASGEDISTDGAHATCEAQVEGPLISIAGEVSGIDAASDEVIVRVSDASRSRDYQPYYLQAEKTEGLGYCAYIGRDAWAEESLQVVLLVNGRQVFSAEVPVL